MNFNSNRTRKHNSFNLRDNTYDQRVDINVTKQFREIHNPIQNTEHITDEITDAQGLERAYADGNYYIHGDTMYIAGSHNLQGWYDDVAKIPFAYVRNAARYQAARDALMENPQVKRTIGHSAVGSVALELDKNCNHRTSSRT